MLPPVIPTTLRRSCLAPSALDDLDRHSSALSHPRKQRDLLQVGILRDKDEIKYTAKLVSPGYAAEAESEELHGHKSLVGGQLP